MSTTAPLHPGDLTTLRSRFWRGAASLSLADAATRLGTTPDALRFRIYRDTCPVPVARESVAYRFRSEDIDDYLESEVAA